MIEPLGWHTVVYSEADILQEMIPFLEAIPTIIVVDHLGRPDMPRDRGGADIKAFNLLLNSHSNIWTKVSGAERLSPMGPPYDDFVEVILPVVGHFFDHVFLGGGGDWSHPNMEHRIPDDGALVDNPMRLHWANVA